MVFHTLMSRTEQIHYDSLRIIWIMSFVLSWEDPDYSTHIGDIIAVAPFFETKMLDMFKNGDFGPDATFVGGMDSKCFGNNCI